MALLTASSRITLDYPFTADKIGRLSAGDIVSLSGRVLTGRDRLHRMLSGGAPCPAELTDGAIFHCGPIVIQKEGGWVLRAAGPTTSSRMDPYVPAIISKCRVRVIIGKGGMGEGVRAACREHGCVYLHAVGGAASLAASRVERVAGVHYLKEFGSAEAVWELDVRDLEAVVTIDASGRSLHKRVQSASRRELAALLK